MAQDKSIGKKVILTEIKHKLVVVQIKIELNTVYLENKVTLDSYSINPYLPTSSVNPQYKELAQDRNQITNNNEGILS